MKNLLKNILVSGKKFVAGANLIALTMAGSGCATAQYRQNKTAIQKAGVWAGFRESNQYDNKLILQEQYGNQDYKTCDVNVDGIDKVVFHEMWGKTPSGRNVMFVVQDFDKKRCISAVYYITREKSTHFSSYNQYVDIIRFQCDGEPREVDEILYKKGTLNKDMACEAIKDFYTNYR